jgi:tRNA threonylcarbamoyladenosine biosynthesis protein TsaB
MSYILGIDTSSIDLGVGLFQDAIPVASYSRFIRNSHAEHIAHIVDMLLKANSVLPSEITHFAVTTGPGSFTGLRIGIAFAKGISAGRHNVVMHAVSSLQVLAYAAQRHDGKIIAAIDARNDEVFWAVFSCANGVLTRLCEDTAGNVEQFKSIIDPSAAIITDTMGYLRSTVFHFLNEHKAVYPVEKYPLQRGLYCALTGSIALDNQDAWINSSELFPKYLRASSAEQRLQGPSK